MSGVFLTLLNMSITASWLILAVIVIRLLLKKAPKWIACALWALVAIRLICPFSFESKLSLIPTSQTIPQNIAMQAKPQIDSGIAIVNDVINPVIARQFTPDPLTSANPLQIVLPVLSIVWIVGMFALLGYALFSYIRLKRSVGASIAVKDNIMVCDEVRSPFILGILRPMIYVPSAMKGDALDYVITHETAHLERHDHWWKPLGYLLLTVYWFNPLCWLAYVLLCRDIELACDEKVIRDLDNGSKASYSQALLNCSYPRKWIAACPLAFGEVGVKERVKSILNYKKPAFWVIVVGILACIVAAVCLLTNPIGKQDTITYTHRSTSIGNRADFNISFGQKARSAMLVAELWQHGERNAESTMVVPTDTQNITILFSDHQENMYLTGETVQIDTDQVAGSLITFFPVLEGVRGWSFSSWNDGQTIDIDAGKEMILAAMNFDTGKGTRSVFDLLEKNNQQIPQDIDCVILIRARFLADELPGVIETAQSQNPDNTNASEFSTISKETNMDFGFIEKWDCSVQCMEESSTDHYVINYSDEKVLSRTGKLTFQNRNGFDIVVHILPEGEAEIVSNIVPAGGCYSLYKIADSICTIGVHADVKKNTEIKLMVYDGDSTEPYIFTEYPDNPVESAGIEMLSPVGTYICEEAGFGGDFVIDLNLDRTFSYSEGPFSSYYGTGEWIAVNETTIELIDRNLDDERRTYFIFNGLSLTFDKSRSDKFIYVDLPDNAVFYRVANETLSDEENVCVGLITDIHNGIIRLQDLTGTIPGTTTQILYVPITKMPSFPEPRIGDRLQIRHNDFETEPELANPIEMLEMPTEAIISLRVIREDGSRTIRDVAFCIDDVIYYSTGRAAPVEPDDSAIRYVEIPVGGANTKMIKAYAILEEGQSAVALYDGEWYEFTAKNETADSNNQPLFTAYSENLVVHGILREMDSDKIVVENTLDSSMIYIPTKEITLSSAIQVGCYVQIIYDGFLTGREIEYADHAESETWIMNPKRIDLDPTAAITIDNVTYYATSRIAPVDGDSNGISFVELPMGEDDYSIRIAWTGIDTLHGDYYFPNLLNLAEQEQRSFGKRGQMHMDYLRSQHPGLFNQLILSGKLSSYLAELNSQAKKRHSVIMKQLKDKEGITEDLKRTDHMEWVHRMTSINEIANEIIQNEMICI